MHASDVGALLPAPYTNSVIRRSSLDVFVWPLALICSLGMALPIWNHHSVLETRAGFADRPQAAAWASREARAHQCLVGHDETTIVDASESGLDLTNGHPITITLRCHRSDIWWKMAAVFIGPWLFFSIIVRMAGPAKEQDH